MIHMNLSIERNKWIYIYHLMVSNLPIFICPFEDFFLGTCPIFITVQNLVESEERDRETLMK